MTFYNFTKIKKIRKSIPRQILITISESFILAHINYCISIYNSLNDKQLKPFNRIIRIVIRLIYGFKPTDYDSITGLMKSLGWLDIANSSKLRLLCITYTAIITKEPRYLHDILTLRNDMRCLRSSNKLILLKLHFNLKSFGKRSFSYNASYL